MFIYWFIRVSHLKGLSNGRVCAVAARTRKAMERVSREQATRPRIAFHTGRGEHMDIASGQGYSNDSLQVGTANIKVIGCGGGGSNMVNWLYKKGVRGAEIIACNTDKQHLDMTDAEIG